jgi:hypothetical protein
LRSCRSATKRCPNGVRKRLPGQPAMPRLEPGIRKGARAEWQLNGAQG